MSNINILDEFTINQIAAGEVVERPSSIVKELVENSIDADSSAITIEIHDGGIGYIRVTDNGIGMDERDAVISLQRHATSKITVAPDLGQIKSLGFRGEALASIAAVTQMELITRTRSNISGMHIINNGGDIVSKKEVGCPEGTTLIIRNLFYNTPARLKFLKSVRAETAHISDWVAKFILSHPEISFKYINQGKIIYHSPGNGSLMSAITCIYGKEVANELIEINECDADNDITLTGYLGKAILSRANRNYQLFFISGRYVKSDLLSSCILEAYKPYLMINRFPWCVLHISLPGHSVDVNVHPAKTEIRFRDEQRIYDLVLNWVKNSLESKPIIPKIPIYSDESSAKLNNNDDERALDNNKEQQKIFESPIEYNRIKKTDIQMPKIADKGKPVIISGSKPGEEEQNNFSNSMDSIFNDHNIDTLDMAHLKVLARAFATYVIIQGEHNLYLVDQHAAHERLIYEKLKYQATTKQIATQQLLPPLIIEVTHKDQLLLNDCIDLFTSIGFDIEHFGGSAFAIRGVPIEVAKTDILGLFHEIMAKLGETGSSLSSILNMDEIIKIACKKAVKANDPLSDKELVALMDELLNEKIPLTCPHGRPIMVVLSKYELEKQFKRVQ